MITNCPHCGNPKHAAVCPLVKAFEYYEDGTVKRVEYKCAADYAPIPVPAPAPGDSRLRKRSELDRYDPFKMAPNGLTA